MKKRKFLEIKLKARAKINLGLDVLGKRPDGYHEVRMIMHTVDLCDEITLCALSDEQIRLLFTNRVHLPANEGNLAYRAAKQLIDEFHPGIGVEIRLNKRIPIAAGLAGGSSDAAAVLVGANQLFGLNLSRKALMERGVRLGADVPYCILRGTALAEGIGEKLTSLPPLPPCQILIAKPKIYVSTRFVYENLKLDAQTRHPDIDGQVAALENGDLRAVAGKMGNVLETVTASAYPAISQIKETMVRHGALNALMSGSGPTVFGIFEEEGAARDACQALRASGEAQQIYLVSQKSRPNAGRSQ